MPCFPQSPLLWDLGPSQSGASSKNELQGSLDVTICGLQRSQHQLLILDPHVPELLHLGLPAALSRAKASSLNTSIKQAHAPELREGNVFNRARKLNFSLLLKNTTGGSRSLCELNVEDLICGLTCRVDMLEACSACCRAWLKRSLLTGVPAGIGATLLEESP